MKRVLRLACGLVACGTFSAPTMAEDSVIRKFTLVERYGVAFPDQVIRQPLSEPIDQAGCRLVDPFGEEVPFQVVEDGKQIAFRATLPASRIRLQKVMFNPPDKNDPTATKDVWAYRHLTNMNHALPVPPGTPIRFMREKLPPMITRGTTYYVTAPRGGTHDAAQFVSLSETPDGPPLLFEPAGILGAYIYSGHIGDDFIAESLPFAVQPGTGRLSAPQHGYRPGERLRVVSDTAPPAPLERDKLYRVKEVDADTFLLEDAEGRELRLSDPGDGKTELYVERVWTLLSGKPSRKDAATDHLVTVKTGRAGYEISNGLTGIRVLKSARGPLDPAMLPAPIQGLQLSNGRWAMNAGRLEAQYVTAMRSLTVTFIEKGPIVTTVQVRYEGDQKSIDYPNVGILRYSAADASVQVNHPYLDYYRGIGPDKPVKLRAQSSDNPLPAPFKEDVVYYARRVGDKRYQIVESPGGSPIQFSETTPETSTGLVGTIVTHFPARAVDSTTTITLQAGQPSILVEDDSNMDSNYSIDFSNEVHPDTGRWRGYRTTPALETGRGPDGAPYLNQSYALVDAEVDLPVTKESAWFYLYHPYGYSGDIQYYYQLFDAKAGDDAPVVGLFRGPASVALGATHHTGPKFFVENPKDGPRRLGITNWNTWMGPDQTIYPRARCAWGIYIAPRRDAIRPQDALQPIQVQENIHAGLNLDKVARFPADFPDRPGGYGPLYMPKPALDAFVQRLRDDPEYEKSALATGAASANIIRFMKEGTREQFDDKLIELNFQAQDVVNELANRGGTTAGRYLYWLGGLEMSQSLPWLNALLGSPLATPHDIARLKSIATLFAAVLHDNDHAPIDNEMARGTANMAVQHRAFRGMYALLLPGHPLFSGTVDEVAASTREVFEYSHNEAGASWSSIHYVGAGDGPLLATMQMLQTAGVADLFKDAPKVAKFAEFYMQALTPPEPRAGMQRRLIPIGDGATEGSETFGVLGTGLAPSNPGLSRRLMGAWRENGSVHSNFHACSLLRIDESLPGETPQLGDATFSGYFSVLRSGWGTPRENAVWCRDGTYGFDHAHEDTGTIIAYMLGAPVSMDWGSFYTPRIAGSTMHSTVVPETTFVAGWDKPCVDGRPFNGGATGGAEAAGLDSWPEGRRMAATIRNDTASWRREITLVNADAEVPVLLIRDTFSGPAAGEAKVWTMNLAAEGPVETPAGPQTPPPAMHPVGTYDAAHGPTVGPVFDLAPGITRLGFTGVRLDKHPAGGIDFDVYCRTDTGQQAHIGSWGCLENNAIEQKQHILRVRGGGPFTTVIVPWWKGSKPDGLQVTASGDGITVATKTSSILFTSKGYTVTRAGTTVERTYTP